MVYVSSVSVSPDKIKLMKGQWYYGATASITPNNATCKCVEWESDWPYVASVNSEYGYIYANTSGTTHIHAKAIDGSGKSDSIVVTVESPVECVMVHPSSVTMNIGDEKCLQEIISPYDASNKTVTWQSSNSSVVEVDIHTGCMVAKSPGKATVTATSNYDKSKYGSCVVTVKGDSSNGSSTNPTPSYVPVTSVLMSSNYMELYVDYANVLIATPCPTNATDRRIKWSSDDESIAIVNNYGYVTAKGVGKTNIRARSVDNQNVYGTCTVVVKTFSPNSTAKEENNKNSASESKVMDPVDVYSGAHVIKSTLFKAFGGQGLSVTAHYNSTQLCNGSLGIGWYHNYEKHLQVCDCEAYVYSSPSVFAKFIATDSSSAFVCTTSGKAGYTLTVDYTQTYPYCLNCNYEKYEYYDALGRLTAIVDRQGFETVISYKSSSIIVTDRISGRKIHLHKDSTGKIVRVCDDYGRETVLSYIGDFLVRITDANDNALSYSYDASGRIKYGVDGQNVRYFENEYDAMGRVITQYDGVGSAPSHLEYGENGERIYTNRNGYKSIRVFNDKGLLERHTDENGNTKIYEYDQNGNIISETDALGYSVKKVYNNFNKPTEITDKNGNTTNFEYDNNGNLTKVTYPEGDGVAAVETYEYNSRNQVVKRIDLRGTETVYTYDENGMPASKKVGNKPAQLYTYLNGTLMNETDALGNFVTYEYNNMNLVDIVTDCDYRRNSYTYDNIGNVTSVTDANCNTTRYGYDTNGQKVSETKPNDSVTRYIYNGNMKLVSIYREATDDSVYYSYDSEDRLIKTTDRSGAVTVTEYDPAGRVVSKVNADGATVTYEYDAAGNVVKETNSLGATTVKTYDKNGNVLTVTDKDGNTVSYTYDSFSRVVKIVNAALGTTTYTYSAAGDLISETDALGNKKTYTYDDYGNKLSFTDANGNVTHYTYDANNNLIAVTDALQRTTTNVYDSRNMLRKTTNARGYSVEYFRDGVGNVTATLDARGNMSYNIYDRLGNVTEVIDALGVAVKRNNYNELGLLKSTTDASGATTGYCYNAADKLSTVIDPMGNVQQYKYDRRGLNTEVTDFANNVSTAQYNALGEKTAVSGPLGGTVRYSYDEQGRLTSESTMSGGVKKYTYNALGLKETLTNARGDLRRYAYDVLGRIIGYTDSNGTVSYTYDKNGNVLTVTDKNGTVTRTFDKLNRVKTCTDIYGKTICYFYDEVGNLVRLTYPDNTSVDYSYDRNNNLISVIDWACRKTEYAYDKNNNCIRVVKPDGSVTVNIYDRAHRLIKTTVYGAFGDVISNVEYEYDKKSRIISEIDLAKSCHMSYTYDNLSRVTQRKTVNICDCSASVENFSYDAAGNISSDGKNKFAYDANNRLMTYNCNPAGYDKDGNMLSARLSGTNTAFEYDSSNRLIKAGDHTYTYNAEDVRIRNVRDGYDTTYTYNTNTRLSQLLVKTTNGVETKYVYGLGLIGEEKCDEFKTYHFDYRGSTIAITDSYGYVIDTFEYDLYGNVTNHNGYSFVIFGYNGRDGVVTDNNGLIYMRARYYSPELKRFINSDIIPGEISDSTSLNRYSYVNGNPASYVDPFGLDRDIGTKLNGFTNNYPGILDRQAFNNQFKNHNAINSGLGWLSEKAKLIVSKIREELLKQTLTVGEISVNDLYISPGVTAYYNLKAEVGLASFDISSVLNKQMEIMSTYSFESSEITYELSVLSDGEYGFMFSSQIDDYSTIAACFSIAADSSMSAGYNITTTDANNNVLSTSFGLKSDINNAGLVSEAALHARAMEKCIEVGVAVGLTAIAIAALAETVATYGAGLWNDVLALSAAADSWKTVFGSASSSISSSAQSFNYSFSPSY